MSLPAGYVGEARGTALAQLRFGQGGGVATRPTHTGTVNSTTFEAEAGSDQTYAVIAQALYHLEWPLDAGRFNDQAGTRAELTLGKLDIFTLFDQNQVAGDEAAAFLNNVFVHNPMLDSGGDIGADSFGFAPGLRAAYFHEGESTTWGLSAGVFASGEGAEFGGVGGPMVIVQAEFSPKQINGEPRGNYRLYAWTNGRTTELDDETEQRHSGFGLSVDQKLGREWNLFGRYGQRFDGDGAFDKALTFGFEHGGRLWGRARDAVRLRLRLAAHRRRLAPGHCRRPHAGRLPRERQRARGRAVLPLAAERPARHRAGLPADPARRRRPGRVESVPGASLDARSDPSAPSQRPPASASERKLHAARQAPSLVRARSGQAARCPVERADLPARALHPSALRRSQRPAGAGPPRVAVPQP